RFAQGNQSCSLSQLFTISADHMRATLATTFIACGLNALALPLVIVSNITAQRRAGTINSR
ncbi:MAG TPA: hypothetical protein VF916_01900, partial [Ktedonobacterales bacterium]